MPVLENLRWEAFANFLAQGKAKGKSYVEAGFRPCPKNAMVLSRKPEIAERVRELQELVIAETKLTGEKVLGELEKLAFSNILDVAKVDADGNLTLDFSRMTREQAAAIASIETDEITNPRTGEVTRRTRFKFYDKRGALVDIGKHLRLFVEQRELNIKGVIFSVTEADMAL